MKKVAARRSELTTLEQLPNVGRSVAADLRRLGVVRPQDLQGRDPYAMYEELCRVTGQRHDPCLLDTFIAAVRFMDGEPAKPWWRYTAERKRALKARAEG
jgi:Pathogenicity locus